MSNYDQAQGPRLGQSQPPENPGVRIVTLAQLPEVAYTGQIVYLADAGYIYIYDGNAWQGVGDGTTGAGPSGSRLFVGETDPALDTNNAVVPGDQWYQPSTGVLKVYDNASTWQDPTPVVPDGSITADKLSATAIDGKTITGATVQTAAPGPTAGYLLRLAPRLDSAAVVFTKNDTDVGMLVAEDLLGSQYMSLSHSASGQALYLGDNGVQVGPLAAASLILNSSRSFSGVDFGNTTVNTNASGDISFSHSLGVNPAVAVAIPGTNHRFFLQAKDASTITLRCYSASGTILGSGVAVQALWIAIAA